jgi:hypothetical protein
MVLVVLLMVALFLALRAAERPPGVEPLPPCPSGKVCD